MNTYANAAANRPRGVNLRPRALVNGKLLNTQTGALTPGGITVENGRITGLGAEVVPGSLSDDFDIIDVNGAAILPGLVDARVHLSDPGYEHKEPLAETALAAVAGGVTSLAGLPDTDPVVDDPSVLEYIARRARAIKGAKIYAYGAATRGLEGTEMAEYGLMQESGIVALSNGLSPVPSAQVMARALSYAKQFNLAIQSHPALPELAGGVMAGGELSTRLGLGGQSPYAEVMQIERDCRLAEMTGGRLHIAPVTTALGCEAIRAAKARGINVTAATAPHYFTLTETSVGAYRTFGKVFPPLRSDADRDAVEAAVCDGTIDIIVSDHWPQDADSKRLPFEQAAPGIVAIETLLALSLKLWHAEKISLPALLAKLTSAPADLLNLPAGRLAEGAAGDVIAVGLHDAVQLTPEQLHSSAQNVAFEHLPGQGRVRLTLVDGRVVYRAEG